MVKFLMGFEIFWLNSRHGLARAALQSNRLIATQAQMANGTAATLRLKFSEHRSFYCHDTGCAAQNNRLSGLGTIRAGVSHTRS
jgi:hypothetical protein